MKFRLLPLSALALSACTAEAKPPADLSFMSGYWLSCANGEQVSETWSDRRGGVLIGVGITTAKGKTSWEFTRIAPATSGAGLSYFAMPSGQAPAEFPLSPSQSTEIKLVFENLAHDFPQRVVYARDGADLTARIEGTINGKLEAMDWRYKAAALNTGCPG